MYNLYNIFVYFDDINSMKSSINVVGFDREVTMRYKKRYSPFDVRYYTYKDEGRPERESVISEDDILNLKILLNTETDLQELLLKI